MTGRFAFLALVAGLGAVTGLAAGRSQGSDTMAEPAVFEVADMGLADQHMARIAPEVLVPQAARRAASEAAARGATEPRPAADIRAAETRVAELQLAGLAERHCSALPGASADRVDDEPPLGPLPQARAGLGDPCGADALTPSPDRMIVE